MGKIIQVRMGEIALSNPPDRLGCTGLGSCVGLILFDPKEQIAGLAHIMLPEGNKKNSENAKIGKYADKAIPYLLEEVTNSGGRPRKIQAKMAGGAHMFSFENDNDISRIGERNIEAVKEKLKEIDVPLLSMDVGGKSGRTIDFNIETGELKVKTFQEGIKII